MRGKARGVRRLPADDELLLRFADDHRFLDVLPWNVENRPVDPGKRVGLDLQIAGCQPYPCRIVPADEDRRSEEHTSELQSLMRISYAVFCLKKKKHNTIKHKNNIRMTVITQKTN